jgi:hypothetical protein
MGVHLKRKLEPAVAAQAERTEAASYIAELSSSLAELARDHGFDTLGHLFEMARVEAEILASRIAGRSS